jgi:rhodanese-related sulfurtransferase
MKLQAYRTFKLVIMSVFCGLVLSISSQAFAGQSISADDYLKMANAPSAPILLDVRTPREFANGHIPNALNIPVANLPDMLDSLNDKSQQIVVYCRSGVRAGRAIKFLESQGYQDVIHLDGDYLNWEEQGFPIEKP